MYGLCFLIASFQYLKLLIGKCLSKLKITYSVFLVTNLYSKYVWVMYEALDPEAEMLYIDKTHWHPVINQLIMCKLIGVCSVVD